MKIQSRQVEAKVPIDMTPMIDIVFQLLVFFIMTLKIADAEGDFNIKMPLSAPSAGVPDETMPPIKMRLIAGSNGDLTDIVVNETSFGRPSGPTDKAPWKAVHNYVAGFVGDGSLSESASVEIDCDYDLHYTHVIDAITSVSGSVGPNRELIKLVENIKFTPPHQPGN